MAEHTVVILGGGTGGLVAARRLRRAEPFPMPTAGPVLGEALAGMLAERGIGFHPNQAIERIDPQARELVLAGGARAGCDLLLGIPAHRPPEAAATSGLAGGPQIHLRRPGPHWHLAKAAFEQYWMHRWL